MAAKPLTDAQCRQAVNALARHGQKTIAAEVLDLSLGSFMNRIRQAKRRGIAATAAAKKSGNKTVQVGDPEVRLRSLLMHGSMSLDEISVHLKITRGKALDLCDALRSKGANVFQAGELYSIEKQPVPTERRDELHLYRSDAKGVYRFGVVSDNHLCSKYAREDVLNDLYDLFARDGITRVYNAGNWIDGEARFNKFDLKVHGMQEQVQYFANNYPQRKGITTYYVAGDDHEGWYSQREGVDIGRMAENAARELGRKDLFYLGYMEAYITLQHAKTKKTTQMLVVHPGGGSSYAISYAPQKYVESLQGGEKPAVVIFGHWHKMAVFNYRNCWIAQAGTTEDQTPFMRKLKLEAHVGGLIIELHQDENGAITDCISQQRRYFDRGYYNYQFNPAGPLGMKRGVRKR
jgi:predicted phosphodiesterase